MKILRHLLWFMVYALPAVLFFSYYPIIGLGANSSMNFELSLPLIWLVIFDLLSFVAMFLLWRKKSHRSDQTNFTETKGASTRAAKNDSPVRTGAGVGLWKKWWGRQYRGLTDRRFFLLSIFPLYLTISVFWSANPLRGLLTAGVMWAVFFAVFSLLFIVPQTGAPRRLRTHALLVMFVSSVLICIFCYAQSIMDTLGLSRDVTLLCPGCTYRSFGFPHPSGFAIEPQFMGNLLLAPTLTALYLVAFRSRKFTKNVIHKNSHLEEQAEHQILHDKIHLPEANGKLWRRIGMVILAGFLSMTLFFTFSRGAIYAYAVAILIMLIFALKRHEFRWSLITIPIVSFILSLGLQGTFAAVGPTAETFFSGIAKSVHQLSLGIIDFRSSVPTSENVVKSTTLLVENSSENGGNSVDKNSLAVDKNNQNVDKIDQSVEKTAGTIDHELTEEVKLKNEATTTLDDVIFEGYVPESTNIRLHLNQAALDTWLSAPGHPQSNISIGLKCSHTDPCLATGKLTPTSVLFGVGLGGAGTALYLNSFITDIHSPKEIVQNEPFSLLLETGLVGIALAVFGLLVVFAPQLFTRKFLDGQAATRGVRIIDAAKGLKFAQEDPSRSVPHSHTSISTKASSSAQKRPLTSNSPHPSTQKTIQQSSRALKASPSPFWHHPALPLLFSLIIAYFITLNFFSGLPNALQIYLMPPLLYLIFSDNYYITTT